MHLIRKGTGTGALNRPDGFGQRICSLTVIRSTAGRHVYFAFSVGTSYTNMLNLLCSDAGNRTGAAIIGTVAHGAVSCYGVDRIGPSAQRCSASPGDLYRPPVAGRYVLHILNR